MLYIFISLFLYVWLGIQIQHTRGSRSRNIKNHNQNPSLTQSNINKYLCYYYLLLIVVQFATEGPVCFGACKVLVNTSCQLASMSSYCNRCFRFCSETRISIRYNLNLNTRYLRTHCIPFFLRKHYICWSRKQLRHKNLNR